VIYCACKAGIAHATRCLAWDYGDKFRFNVVHPYHVPETPMGERTVEHMLKDRERFPTREAAEDYQRKDLRFKELDGSPRELTAGEVAGLICELVTDAPGAFMWLNGQGLNLYGGVR